MKNLYNLYMTGILLALALPAYCQISGRVESKINNNNENLKNGLAQITVRAFDNRGVQLISTMTDAVGNYRLNLPSGQRVRLEFSDWPQGFTPASGQKKVQFITTPSEINFSLWQPGQYVGSRPQAVQAIYTSQLKEETNPKRQAASPTAISNSLVAVLAGQGQASSVASQAFSSFATTSQTGAVWGLAYERISGRLFASSFAKRHSALGPLGAGGIYVVKTTTVSQANNSNEPIQPFVDLASLGILVGPPNNKRDIADKEAVFNHDSLLFSMVGKMGLGGIDVSDDGGQLWVMNLYNRKLYRINLSVDGHKPTSTDITGYTIKDPGYRHGQFRPFAVKYYAGKVYIGVVNDASGEKATSADLKANVLAFDPIHEKFEDVFEMSLDYKRGKIDYGVSDWRPWTDDYNKTRVVNNNGWMIYPQAILADIEFDTDGSMILGFMDRLGHQTGEGQLYRPKGSRQLQQIRGISGGDVLRVAFRPTESGQKRFEMEKNGQAGNRITAGKGNGEGPGGGEYYFDDAFKANGVVWHQETATGGLALLPDQGQVLVATREPEPEGYLGGGIKWFNNKSGNAERSLSLLPRGQTNPFGKANNVGDIELITDIPPTEIGDRIWQDCDEDGIQDADENPLADVEVGLYQKGKLLASTKSNSKGEYLFTDAMIKDGIHPRTAYELRVLYSQPGYKNLALTTIHQGSNQEVDNDALGIDGYASIKFETTNPGENLHHLDFGFHCIDKPKITAKLSCSGQTQTATLTLSGQKIDTRFDLVTDRAYTGNAVYENATKLEENGQVLSTQLVNWPEEITIRVFNASGCFSDLFIKQTDAIGCDQGGSNEDRVGLAVSPNPTSDYLLVGYRSKNLLGSIKLLLTDMQGRPLLNQSADFKQGRYQTKLNLRQYPIGSYILTIQDGDSKLSQIVLRQ